MILKKEYAENRGMPKHFYRGTSPIRVGTVGLSETRTALFLNFAVGHFLDGSSLGRIGVPVS
jgi:hypothetical protein